MELSLKSLICALVLIVPIEVACEVEDLCSISNNRHKDMAVRRILQKTIAAQLSANSLAICHM